MARESLACCASVLEAPVSLLEANGTALLQARSAALLQTRSVDYCSYCDCPLGNHLAVLPGDVTADNLLDLTGWIECPACDTSCGIFAVALPSW